MKGIIYAVGFTLVLLTSFQTSKAQKKADQTLFTYGGKEVGKSEFLRMYTKNINNQKPDFSEKALKEYLNLYSRFKMKVAEAERMQMDTLSGIQSELGTYKKQLAKTYLTDKEVSDRLVKEAYERMKKDVRVAHILIGIPRGTEDTVLAFRKIDSIYKEITLNKADFASIAKSLSEDKQSATNGGDIGFITAMQVVYPFETAAYNTPQGTYSKPFKTIYGYHIIKKLEERTARGEVQVAQVMVAVQKSAGEAGKIAGKARIDSVYTMLKKGQKFETMVDKYSEDKFSKNTQGTLASFGVGQMVPDFENAAFALKNPGDICEPILTEYGYHILKLIKKTPVKPYDSMKNDLTRRVEKDGRIDIARQEFTEKIKAKLGYKEYPSNLTTLINAIPDSSVRNGSFKGSDYKTFNSMLFTMKETTFTQSDFANYIESYTRGKIYGQKESSLKSLFKNYADKALYDYQENKLADENEEYRNLLDEYRDGIMLFELTDKTVWTKASVDTTGLENYYNQNKSKYMWAPSVKGNLYKASDESFAKKLVKELNNPQNKTPEEVTKAANGDGPQNRVVVETGKFEKSRFPASTKFVEGKYSPYFKNDDGTYSVIDVKEVFDTPTQKTLGEARGYVISEYQEYLEKQWIADLESKYPVKVNDAVLKSMVKK
ncbi:MAG: peptidylprolyl isomerase [Chitinophagaceae bacterium]|nr:peptidylprolyl isomerase [Chitinophagaceae bacterium]